MTKNKIKKTNNNIANNAGSQINPSAPRSQIEIYQNKDNKTEIEVQFDNETFCRLRPSIQNFGAMLVVYRTFS